ncbi:MAG: Mur ligase family protein [Balneolaceae bacterium]
MAARRFTTIEDAAGFLDGLPKFSLDGLKAARFGLDQTKTFCERAGNPQDRVRTIHVAGTNGKGTTCQMLASVFQQAGYKTGLYTSPHLMEYNERIRVNSRNIPDRSIVGFFNRFGPLLESMPLTYFEISTCMAFWHFAEEMCDIAIIETGLGGRLDATNIIDPLVSVITSVSADHMDVLGKTIPEIAREKAGIIKQGKPVVTGHLPEGAMKEAELKAASLHAELIRSSLYRPGFNDGLIELTEPGSQNGVSIDGRGRKPVDRFNVAIVMAVVDVLSGQFPGLKDSFTAGVEKTESRFPDHARFQKLLSGRSWYFDGAHNPEAIGSLMEQVLAMGPDREPVFFLSFMKDKIVPGLLENFQPYKYVYYIDSGRERNADCNQIRSQIPQAECLSSDDPDIEGLLEGLKSKLVIFAGSFYFYRQVKYWMASQPPSDHKKNPGLCP